MKESDRRQDISLCSALFPLVVSKTNKKTKMKMKNGLKKKKKNETSKDKRGTKKEQKGIHVERMICCVFVVQCTPPDDGVLFLYSVCKKRRRGFYLVEEVKHIKKVGLLLIVKLSSSFW